MKKQLLFNAMVLIGLTSIAATRINVVPQEEDFTNTVSYRYVEPIMFMEQGIEFLIFPDGSFDFKAHLNNRTNSYGRDYSTDRTKSRRTSVNNNPDKVGTVNGRYVGTTKANGVIIERNYNGMIKRIGNVVPQYDKHGRIKRLGSTKMNYDDGKLSKVGGLKVKYNRWDEIISVRGTVNATNKNYHYGTHYNTVNASPVYKVYANQDGYYYYKQGASVKKQKKIKR